MSLLLSKGAANRKRLGNTALWLSITVIFQTGTLTIVFPITSVFPLWPGFTFCLWCKTAFTRRLNYEQTQTQIFLLRFIQIVNSSTFFAFISVVSSSSLRTEPWLGKEKVMQVINLYDALILTKGNLRRDFSRYQQRTTSTSYTNVQHL